MTEKILFALNRMFKLPVHPFNLQNDGVKTYAMWQYEKGADTIKFYTERYSPEEMFRDKDVLDVGCGAGGKTMYYASLGAKSITGIDVVPHYKEEAEALARQLGFADKFRFVVGDAANTEFDDDSFDTIIMNDAMEHVARPEAVLRECRRILKRGGRLYVNFPPYNHPYGAHLSDLISIPWVHVMFSDKTLISCYKELCKSVPDGDERIAFRISKRDDGTEYFSYINKMSIKRFADIRKNCPMRAEYYREVPLRSIVKPLAKLPFFKEFFVKMAVCVFVKDD